jgi:hypothetical protein
MTPEEIRANAGLVVQQLREPSGIEDFGYNMQSVAWVDEYIEQQRSRSDLSKASIDRLIQTLGAFLGESVIANYGGQWRQTDEVWEVVLAPDKFRPDSAVYPFAQVLWHLRAGRDAGHGTRAWFQEIPVTYGRNVHIVCVEPERRPWWKIW